MAVTQKMTQPQIPAAKGTQTKYLWRESCLNPQLLQELPSALSSRQVASTGPPQAQAALPCRQSLLGLRLRIWMRDLELQSSAVAVQ
jgi:hypothetical protein